MMTSAACAMPTSGSAPDVLLDTGAVALTVGDHEDHQATIEKLSGRGLGLSGPAAEAYRLFGVELEMLNER